MPRPTAGQAHTARWPSIIAFVTSVGTFLLALGFATRDVNAKLAGVATLGLVAVIALYALSRMRS